MCYAPIRQPCLQCFVSPCDFRTSGRRPRRADMGEDWQIVAPALDARRYCIHTRFQNHGSRAIRVRESKAMLCAVSTPTYVGRPSMVPAHRKHSCGTHYFLSTLKTLVPSRCSDRVWAAGFPRLSIDDRVLFTFPGPKFKSSTVLHSQRALIGPDDNMAQPILGLLQVGYPFKLLGHSTIPKVNDWFRFLHRCFPGRRDYHDGGCCREREY
jgi:hypothetical protein